MATSKRSSFVGFCTAVALLLALAVPTQAASTQSVSGTLVEFDGDSDGDVTSIKLSLGPDRMRLDAPGVSVVSLGGADGKMLMMMHEQRQYMEFTAEMMASMAAMMGQMPVDLEAQIADADTTPPTFTRTGNTKQVGEWAAYEVLVEHPDNPGTTIMWFSQDLDVDFRSLAQQVVDSMSSLLDNPMLQGMGGGGGGGGNMMDQIEAQLNAPDMPDGFPVQIISDNGGNRTVNTLKTLDQNATFDASTWEAPEGYSRMAMPFGR